MDGDAESVCGGEGPLGIWSASTPPCLRKSFQLLWSGSHLKSFRAGELLLITSPSSLLLEYLCIRCYPSFLVPLLKRKEWNEYAITQTFPICLSSAVDCGQPRRPENGKLNGAAYKYQDTVGVECGPGFYLVGADTLTCNGNADWEVPNSGEYPECAGLY